ncbi:LPXTG cell wall anchor domain-containing protein [Pediococcus stilesii]|uniref:LPXTG cell wall anchor domain-containing protein n=1 Tax=Pediococcus stilesii TaxID=331679 RepID=A0A5R9BXW1_9LACO|nr:LPXTG cell wall anchor domain-containing protein [Pediococcus stilesii]TLQ04841.1 LPXTG cell wall anchor domain-containing protein [Pediococcus stilesii]
MSTSTLQSDSTSQSAYKSESVSNSLADSVSNTENKQNKLPQTGEDNNNALVGVGLLFTTLAELLILIGKKKKDKE